MPSYQQRTDTAVTKTCQTYHPFLSIFMTGRCSGFQTCIKVMHTTLSTRLCPMMLNHYNKGLLNCFFFFEKQRSFLLNS